MADFSDLVAATSASEDPTTSGADLALITQAHPRLWPQVASHPNAHRDLLVWLGANGDAATKQTAAERLATTPLPVDTPPPPAAAVAEAPEPPPPVRRGSPGWAVLGFFIPILGLILWLVWKSARPGDSKMALNGFYAFIVLIVLATAGFLVSVFTAA